MPSKKRKSDGGQQVVISKFFKPSSQTANRDSPGRSKKKVPVIHIIEDDENLQQATQLSNTETVKESNEVLSDKQNAISPSHHNNSACASTTFYGSAAKLQKFALKYKKNVDENQNCSTDTTSSHQSLRERSEKHLERIETSMEQRFDNGFQKFTKASENKSKVGRNEKNNKNESPMRSSVKVSYTPLEQQIVDIKRKHEDVLLFVECGYKYRFFGKDAQIAAKELNIYCHMDHNFMTASIPVHRLNVHVSRLVEKGYKVGIVKQVETAALKAAGDNKSALFTREITNVYTKATYIDRTDQSTNASPGNFILSVDETWMSLLHHNVYSVVVVNPTTSEIIYSQYVQDDDLMSNIETMFAYFKPCEMVLPKETLKNSSLEKFVSSYTKNSIQNVLVERYDKNELPPSPCISMKSLQDGSTESYDDGLLACISLLAAYLSQFKLDGILGYLKNYKKFCKRNDSMVLDGITHRNLELFENNSNGGVKGSLFWKLDHTCTPFGRRLLKRWLGNPLVDKECIEQRLNAIEEVTANWESSLIRETRKELAGCPDLENALTIICLRKANPERFVKFVEFMERIRKLFLRYKDESARVFSASLLKDLYKDISIPLGTRLQDLLKQIDRDAAMSGRKENLFKADENFYPEVYRIKKEIQEIEHHLERHRKTDLPKLLKKFSVEYKCISGLEYLVEVKNSELKLVPSDWMKVSATKQCCRYRPPVVDDCFKELCRKREQLTIAANNAWTHFLGEFACMYEVFRDTIEYLSCFDCLMSLSVVAKQPCYCRPCFDSADDECIEITGGRHPVVESILTKDAQYVANDVRLSHDQKVMLISGPNMGGKSSLMKQVAINCILAQMGSFVAASHGKFSVLDGIYTRMGASDNMARNKSTFMVELEEAARIIRQATCKSLVILDELGRGTSTFDGMAIASATLKYFVEDVKSFTLFVSHYPILSEFEEKYTTCLNYHMGYLTTQDEKSENSNKKESQPEESSSNSNCDQIMVAHTMERSDGHHTMENSDEHRSHADSIVFLYKLTNGLAGKSYGLNVARLAHIDQSIIEKAAIKSKEMEEIVDSQRKFRELFKSMKSDTDDIIIKNIQQLAGDAS